jgi:streptogramin lyase
MKGFLRSKLVMTLALVVMIAAAAIPLSGSITSTHAQATVTFTEFPIPTSNSTPNYITKGPDGNLWFTEEAGSKIGKITPSGKITEFQVSTSQTNLFGITAGPDGNIWFTEEFTSKIGKITPSGTITEYPTSGNPYGITAGPDGNIWFTEDGNTIGRITPSGTITEFPLPSSGNPNIGITAGPDGNIWFTVYSPNRIGRITPSGTVTEFQVPTSAGPVGITTGPDGHLWFTEQFGNTIGKITTSGAVTEYPVPTSNSFLESITAGPDGTLWFAEGNANNIGRITPSGTVNEFPVPTSNSGPNGITTGPDGNLWFTEYEGNKIGRIKLSNPPNPPVTHWQSPKNGFYVQDDHATLSVSVASGTNQITGVTFTASWDNNINVSICNGGLAGRNWVCQWAMDYNGTHVRNGPITFGYTVTTALQNFVNPDGSRSGTIVYELTDFNPIYAGYATASQNDAVAYTMAVAKWTVPKAKCGTLEISRSAIWAGIAGANQLAQIATASMCNLGKPNYGAYWEDIPFSTQAQSINKTVVQGDKMVATVAYVSSSNTFNLTLVDSGKWTFTTPAPAMSDPSERSNGECIVEDPESANGSFIFPLTNFGTVSVDCQVDSKPVANGPEDIKFLMVSNIQKATTNPLATNGEVFTVVWQHS